MKKYGVIIGVLILAGLVAVPVFAGRGHGPGRWGGGYGACWSDGPGGPYGNITEEKAAELDQIRRNHYDETNQLRNELWTKKDELGSIFSASDPDIEKAKEVQSQVSEIKAKLDQKRLEYRFKVKEIVPESGNYYGPGRKYGRGRHMADWGRGPGFRDGYGQGRGYGPCWN